VLSREASVGSAGQSPPQCAAAQPRAAAQAPAAKARKGAAPAAAAGVAKPKAKKKALSIRERIARMK